MNKYFFVGLMSFAMTAIPAPAVFAVDGSVAPVAPIKLEIKQFTDPCVFAANQRRQIGSRAAQTVYANALKQARAHWDAANKKAKSIEDDEKRYDALAEGEDAYYLSKYNAESVLRLANRETARLYRLDTQMCKEQQAAKAACLADALNAYYEQVKGLQGNITSALEAIKTELNAEREAANGETAAAEDEKAVAETEEAMRETKKAAETELRREKDIYAKELSNERTTCIQSVTVAE